VAAVEASVASGAAASVAGAAAEATQGGVRPDHPTSSGRPPVCRDLHDAADHGGIGSASAAVEIRKAMIMVALIGALTEVAT
jgi:hypothetical protein